MRRVIALLLMLALIGAAPPPKLETDVALASLIAIGDAHFTKLADTMRLAANTDAARSHQWPACGRCSKRCGR